MTDPFEHFGEEHYSWEMLEQHREQLVAEAAEIVRSHPEARPVGVIMDSAAPEAAEFLKSLQKQTGQPVTGFVGVMPLHMLLDVVRANHPDSLDSLENADRVGSEQSDSERVLPLVALTKGGMRTGAIGYRIVD